MISWQGASSQFTKSARPCDEMIAGYWAGELGQMSWTPSITWTAKANIGTTPKAKNGTTRGHSGTLAVHPAVTGIEYV
jgi:hypothetical protein